MLDPGQLLGRLDQATRTWRVQLEAPWGALRSLSEYSNRLVRIYGVVAPFEAACRYAVGIDEVLAVRPLNRSGLIARDLLVLGLTPQQVSNIPSCPAITGYGSPAELLGWFYVVDRATSIDGAARRQLIARIPKIEGACAYLAAREGDDPLVTARLFDRVTAPVDQIIGAAQLGFAAASTWLSGFRQDTQRAG